MKITLKTFSKQWGKPVSLMTLYLLALFLIWSCSNDQEEPTFEENRFTGSIEPDPDVKFLSSRPGFYSSYSLSLSQLSSFQSTLCNRVDLSGLRIDNGRLVFRSVEDLQNIMSQLEDVNQKFENELEKQIDVLLTDAKNDASIVRHYESSLITLDSNLDEEIVNGIEELLWSDGMFAHNMQECIDQKIPISTLWRKVKTLSDTWLARATDEIDIDLSKDPADDYIDDDLMRLLLDENASVVLGNEVHTFIPDALTDSKSVNNVSTWSSNCRTWKRASKTGNNGSRKLKVRVSVRNFVFYKTLKANIKGWKRRRGKWRKRRFTKTLNMGGNAIIHRASLSNNCDPVFTTFINLSETRRRKSFKITRTWWGGDWYVAAVKNQFSGIGNVGSLNVSATIQ
ncbi:hypothetical protein [Ascidiimonas aurantiaca]|uniref:hypothetical protein n=1 Tax=Ascidiimonas aurantiaca TaxID=1685432 RepID=UPI0030EDC7FC